MPLCFPNLDESVEHSTPLRLSYPFSVSCWFRTTDDNPGFDQTIWSEHNDDIGDLHAEAMLIGDGTNIAGITTVIAGSGAEFATQGTVSVDTWHHGCGTFDTSLRQFSLDGQAFATNSNTQSEADTASTLLRSESGGIIGGAFNEMIDGAIFMLGIWNVQLNQDEADMLALGLCPLMIRPANLAEFRPYVRDHDSRFDRPAYTENGTPNFTEYTNPPVMWPQENQIAGPKRFFLPYFPRQHWVSSRSPLKRM